LALGYLLAAKLGLYFAIPPGNATAVWPASGIALVALLRGGYRFWPGIWLGSLIANATTEMATSTAAAVATGNTLEAVLFVWLFHRLLSDDRLFRRVQDAFLFALIATVSCTLAATVGAVSLRLSGRIDWSQFAANWWTWWLGDVAGLMILAPLILVSSRDCWRGKSAVWWAELLFGFLLLVLVSQCIFGGWLPERLAANMVYVTLVFLIWVCLRFGLSQVTLAMNLLTVAAVWGASSGVGAYRGGLEASLFDLQIFMNIYALTGLALAGMVARRRAAEAALQQSHDGLERQVRARTEDLERVNRELVGEVAERRRTEEELRLAREQLQWQVQQQSADLSATNQQLQREMAERDRLDHWFRQVLEASPDALIIANHKGRVVLVNDAAKRLFGYSDIDLVGQSIETLVPESRRERHRQLRASYLQEPYARLMGTGAELSGRRRDGSVFPAEIALGPMKTAGEWFVFCAVRDITDRKAAEQALRDSEERFQLAVQGTDAGIWDWDLRTNVVYFSPRWKGMLGYEDDEIRDDFSEWESRLHPDERQLARDTIDAYLTGKTAEFELEHRLRHRDGSYRWILSRGAAVRDAAGRPYRMVGSHLDITHRKQAEARYREHEAQLIAAEEIQRHLLPQSPPVVAGLDIAGHCYPAEFAAGDHFDFLPLSNGSLAIVVGDVCGHGVGPAILMASLHAHIRTFAETYRGIPQILGKANRVLLRESVESRFVTLLAVQIDPLQRTMTYVNCGHPPGLILNAAGELKAELPGRYLPLGVLPDVEYSLDGPILLEAGDAVLLMTDGILEAAGPDGSLFGAQRTRQVFQQHRERPAAEIVQTLYRAARDFAGTDQLNDDVTLAVIRVLCTTAEAT
jgi:PAS domain S-box-containing protein